MTEGTMANYTASILISPPFSPAYGLTTARVNGASELKAGYIVTEDGHTWPDVGRPDAVTDIMLGVALELPDVDIDTYFADDEEITIALLGSGAVVWCYANDAAAAVFAGQRMYCLGSDDDGTIRPYSAAATAPTTYDDATVIGIVASIEQEATSYIGRCVTTNADQGSDDVPIKIALV